MSKGRQRRPRHVIGGPELPKGAIPLPTGGYQLPGSTSIFRDRHGKHHGITVSGVVRDEIDIKRFTHALLDVVKRMQDNERDQAA